MTNQQTETTIQKEILKRVAVYIRTSAIKQTKEGFGPEVQKKILSSFVESNKNK